MFRSDTIIQARSIGDKNKIVVNLDIGDTYSGYSYITKNEFLHDKWTVHMNNFWPVDEAMTYKTATTLLLKPHGGFEYAKYGYEAEKDYKDKIVEGEHEKYYLFRNIKKEFYKDGVDYDTSIQDKIRRRKKPLCEIMLAMIRYFKSEAMARVQQRFDGVPEKEVFWVLTVPAAWKLETCMLYRDLAVEAGINSRNLRVVTEPEACIAYVMQYLKTQITVSEQRDEITSIISHFDARVVVLDLSGDATTISVHRVSGDKTFKMVYQSRSQRKGSNQVNEQFLLFLSNLIGEDIIRTLEREYIDDYLTLCTEFEMRKRKINPETSNNHRVSFPLPRKVEETFEEKHKGENTEYKSISERISMRSEYSTSVKYKKDKLYVEVGVLKGLFDIVLDNIAVYIRNVLQMESCARVASFMLVGGFSQSRLVQEGIRERFPEMLVIAPTDPELAITKGAIMMSILPEVRPPSPPSGQYFVPQQSAVCNIV